MENNITNIINYNELTRIRRSGNSSLIPKPNTIVSLEVIERLEKGAKVLINGKLFIAIIDEVVPLKEEMLAWVKSTENFSVTLNFEKQLNKKKEILLSEILQKLSIPNNSGTKTILAKIIKEKKPLIKTKINLLFDVINELDIELSNLQLLLLVNLVWNNAATENDFAKDIVQNLFDQTFNNVCEQFVEITKELLFTEIPSFVRDEIKNNIIYYPEENNVNALTHKNEFIVQIIKTLNNIPLNGFDYTTKKLINKFTEYGSKYLLQKVILNEYDYYPDFIAVKHNADVVVINVEIKKVYLTNNEPSYTINFHYKGSPVELNGFVKNYFLMGNIKANLNNREILSDKIESFRKSLKQKWSIDSNITFNNEEQRQMLYQLERLEVNKLVS